MKIHLYFSSISVLFALFVSLQIAGQPCDNGISTNPANPINNQFVQMGNDFFPGNGTDTFNPFLNSFDWYFGNSTIQLFPNQVNWTHFFSNYNSVVNMQHPFGGSMPSEFQYLRPNGVNPEYRDFRWEDGWELLKVNFGRHVNDSLRSILPNMPYMALYNKYTGTMRFLGIWPNVSNSWQIIRFKLTLLGNKYTYDGSLNRSVGWHNVTIPEDTFLVNNLFDGANAVTGSNYDMLLQPYGWGVIERDFHWEDGWELLYFNTGYYPNGEGIELKTGKNENR